MSTHEEPLVVGEMNSTTQITKNLLMSEPIVTLEFYKPNSLRVGSLDHIILLAEE